MLEEFLSGRVGTVLFKPFGGVPQGMASAFSVAEWCRLVAGCLVCLAACAGVAGLAGVPAEPGFGGSLLAGAGPVLGLVVAWVILGVGLVIGTAVAGSISVEAALFCATLGLTALAVRAGPIRPVLQYAAGRGVFVALAVESALLGAAVCGCGWLLDRAAGVRPGLASEEGDATIGQKMSALGVGVGVAAACELILVQTPAGGQALAGVAIASFLGALAAYSYLPMGEGIWYWTAPTVLGLIAYLLAWVTGDGGPTGDLHGWGAALARPTPLDYASLGTAMAVFGHWSCRRWAAADAPPELTELVAAE